MPVKFGLLCALGLVAGGASLSSGAVPGDAAPRVAGVRGHALASDPPSPAQVLGYELGERFTDHAGIVRYLEALAAASPRVRVWNYGETVEGRPLMQVVVAREDYLARLEEILARNRELADPATPEARARAVAASTPAVVYFSYGVHGNESSSSEAALWTAWDLARGAPAVGGVLDSVVVILDPALNPDGRDRYVQWYRQALGRRANRNPQAWEHWEPWPGGRYNHYLFDLNRDWAWLTQRETRARHATWSRWTPQVHVDFHEMDYRSSYFFFPAAPPINPLYPDHILRWGQYFGQANAAAFDEEGWAYYTGEGFDLFYPGYGDTWPSLLGAIGMTYEQAGHARAGLAVERPDGLVLTLRDRAQHHRTSSEATLAAAARRKTELQLDFARFHRGVGEGMPDVLLVPGSEPGAAEALVALLRGLDIRVERAARSFRAEAVAHTGFAARRDFPAGAYRVPARQARGRLALTLLQPETVLNATFSYDVSAWSLPYAFGVEAHRAERVPEAGWQALEPMTAAAGAPPGGAARAAGEPPSPYGIFLHRAENGAAAASASADSHKKASGPPEPEPYGYLLAPGFASWPGVVRFLDSGGRALVLDEPFTIEGRAWPAGTTFLPRHGNVELTAKVQAAGLAERARPVRTGWTTEGKDLGTGEAYPLELPRVAVLMGPGFSPTSFGAHWFFLEQTLGLPFDAVPVEQLGGIDLREYDVLVLPEGDPRLDDQRVDQLKAWVRAGGTLVAVGGAARRVATPLAEIKVREGEKKEGDQKDAGRALRGREERELERWHEQVPGTILAASLDPAHPLAFGAGVDGDSSRLFVLQRGNQTFEPDTSFESVAYFPDKLAKISGVISDKNLERMAKSTWIAARRLGRGRVVLFAEDPMFRHFWFAGFQPLTNALMLRF